MSNLRSLNTRQIIITDLSCYLNMSPLIFQNSRVRLRYAVPKIEIFQIDAFTDKVFHGNPAAICLLDDWLNDELLEAIAFENNLSETAFIIESTDGYQIRWFTPNGEVDLCGHATMAAGFLLFELGKCRSNEVQFSSLRGTFKVQKKGELLTLSFPRLNVEELESCDELIGVIDQPFETVFISDLDYLVLLSHEKQVLQAQVDLQLLKQLPKRGLILTSTSTDADFYSRCFYPKHNIPEDPVTGSAHCILAPFWSERLNRKALHAIQGSFRKGEIFCEIYDNHVDLSGHCKWYLKGHLVI